MGFVFLGRVWLGMVQYVGNPNLVYNTGLGTLFVNCIAIMPARTDDNECETNNGGCHTKRKCINLPGSMRCDNCQAGWLNDGAKGCKGWFRVLDWFCGA